MTESWIPGNETFTKTLAVGSRHLGCWSRNLARPEVNHWPSSMSISLEEVMDQRPAVELELVDLNEQLLEGVGGRDELLFYERHPFPLMAGRMRLDPAELRT